MSKTSKRRKKLAALLAERKVFQKLIGSGQAVTDDGDDKQDGNDEQRTLRLRDFPPWLFGVGIAVLANVLSGNPRAAYFSVAAIIIYLIWACWIVWDCRTWWKIAAAFASLVIIYVSSWLIESRVQSANRERANAALMQTNLQTALGKVKAAYIKGTEYTYNDMQDEFPFGYVVFFANGDKMFFESPSKNIIVKADWNAFAFVPHYADKTFTFSDPGMEITYANNVTLSGVRDTATMPMKIGTIYALTGVYDKGVPQTCVGFFDGSQKEPVFVVGFRIIQAPKLKEPSSQRH